MLRKLLENTKFSSPRPMRHLCNFEHRLLGELQVSCRQQSVLCNLHACASTSQRFGQLDLTQWAFMHFLHSVIPKVLGERGHLWLKPGVPLCVLSLGSAHEAVAAADLEGALSLPTWHFSLSSGPPQMHASSSSAFLWYLTEQQHAPVAAQSSQNAPAGAFSAFLILTHDPLALVYGDRSVLNSGSSKNDATSGLRLRETGLSMSSSSHENACHEQV